VHRKDAFELIRCEAGIDQGTLGAFVGDSGMVGAVGFPPTTLRVKAGYSWMLSYAPLRFRVLVLRLRARFRLCSMVVLRKVVVVRVVGTTANDLLSKCSRRFQRRQDDVARDGPGKLQFVEHGRGQPAKLGFRDIDDLRRWPRGFLSGLEFECRKLSSALRAGQVA
jgi:hypothetical protein